MLVFARRMSATEQLRRPSQQHYNLALKWSSHRRVYPRGAASSTFRRDAVQQGRELLPLRSIS